MQMTGKTIECIRAAGVTTLYLFGSHAEGTARPDSDYDFAVLMRDPAMVHPSRDTLTLYDALYRCLSDAVPENVTLDIVFLQRGVSLELQANVIKYGKVLIDDASRERLDYEAQVMLRMGDVAPILRMMDEAILQRL